MREDGVEGVGIIETEIRLKENFGDFLQSQASFLLLLRPLNREVCQSIGAIGIVSIDADGRQLLLQRLLLATPSTTPAGLVQVPLEISSFDLG